MKTLRKVGVIGCGRMGIGIARIAAQAGLDVILVKMTTTGSLDQVETRIASGFGRARAKNRLDQAGVDAARARLTVTSDLDAVGDADIVIECTLESLACKRRVLADIENVTGGRAIIATNTSSLALADLAAPLATPANFLALHFFSPVDEMKLVELAHTDVTSNAVIDACLHFTTRLGKTTIVLGDEPGYLVNRLLVPQLCHAIEMLEHGAAGAKEIDLAMRLGCGHPMGPLALADFIGLDVLFAMAQALGAASGDRRFRAPHLLRRLVQGGHLGKKTGLGIYDYRGEEPVENPEIGAAVLRPLAVRAAS